MSLISIENKSGPRIDPWGIPECTLLVVNLYLASLFNQVATKPCPLRLLNKVVIKFTCS